MRKNIVQKTLEQIESERKLLVGLYSRSTTLPTKRPSIAACSAGGWFRVNHVAGVAWSNGHILDLSGVPHIRGWDNRISPSRDHDTPRLRHDAAPLIPIQRGETLAMIAEYQHPKYPAIVLCGAFTTLVNPAYVAYFISKHKRCEFTSAREESEIQVWAGDKLVGIIMPIRLSRGLDDTLENLNKTLAESDAMREQVAA